MSADEASSSLPEDPLLAAMAASLGGAGHFVMVVDDQWRLVYVSEDQRLAIGAMVTRADFAIGEHMFSTTAVDSAIGHPRGANSVEMQRTWFAALGPLILAHTPGGHAELRELVHPQLLDIVDGLTADDTATLSHGMPGLYTDGSIRSIPGVAIPQHDNTGRLAGTVLLLKIAAGMRNIAAVTAEADLGHLDRFVNVSRAGRRPAAVLMADLEASTPLARRLSTAAYFSLGRRLVSATDRCVVEAGGLVGRHVGDGAVAFFLAETMQSESAAARACISAARNITAALDQVAQRSALSVDDIRLRFGLHWGATLYVGNITTSGRSEVTALGDEVNETARIEACATGARTLASKALLERLDPDDAAQLGLDPDSIVYTPLAELTTATDKARRDAPAIAVCDI